jgi:uncharacterized membrane protein
MSVEQAKFGQPFMQRVMPALDGQRMLVLLGIALLPLGLLLPLPAWLKVPLGFVVVLLAPGYALLEALFSRREYDTPARIGLSFGLSIAILPILALVLDALPWGLRVVPIAVSLTAWIMLCALAMLLRSSFWQREAATGDTNGSNLHTWWRSLGKRTQLMAVAGTIAFVGVLMIGFAAMATPDPTEQMTEFYALGPDGLAENYPREVDVGEVMQVQLGITNREGVQQRYRVEVRSASQLLGQAGPIELADGATWNQPIQYALQRAGMDQAIDIVLFHQNDSTPYRTLRLWVNVREIP